MYLSTYQLAMLGKVMTLLSEPFDEFEMRTQLGQLMLNLLGAQYYASYVWDERSHRFDGGVQINFDPSNLRRYEEHYQYHDPITFKLQQHRTAARVTDVMPQRDLKQTEFFNDFLARDGLHWGINLYAWAGDRNIGDMRIWRDKRHDNFLRQDMELLNLVRPLFVAALLRGRGCGMAPSAPREAAGAVSHAPCEVLSPRQREVARLAAQGLPDKAIALRLGISVTTVRTHIDQMFRKLGVDNRMALVQRISRMQ